MIYRKLYKSLVEHLPYKEFSIVTGARQTGKSTLLRQLETHCSDQEIPTVFINLENRLLLGELDQDPKNIFSFIPDTSKKVVVFVDEVQYLKDPSNFLKLLYDDHHDQLKIVATGSSAFYIDSHFKDSMAGRKRLFHLNTCSFEEYLSLKGKDDLLNEKELIVRRPDYRSTRMSLLRAEWDSYLVYGGYPAVVTEVKIGNKVERLKELRDSFVKRDITEAGVTNSTVFYTLFRILAAQTGNLLNINELSSSLRVKNDTVSRYLLVMRKCFHIGLVSPFHRNLRKELI